MKPDLTAVYKGRVVARNSREMLAWVANRPLRMLTLVGYTDEQSGPKSQALLVMLEHNW